ncbi:MAG: flagellar biosynthesis protein FlgG [Hydrogenimonas sp.]|nr:MAG: flagellar biosynthesis protein FlgG [Hydrogenimonas sp.]
MQNGYYSVTGAMVTQFNRLDRISNNLANLNTPGFKEQKEVVGDFMKIFQEKRDELPLKNHTKASAQFLNRTLNRVPRIVEEYTDFQLGAMTQTGNPLDLALGEENLFFTVQTPSGLRLTRNGAFQRNDQGVLVTKDGFPVLSKNQQPIQIPPEAVNITINPTGRIEYREADNMAEPVYLDDLMVVRMDNPQDLQAEGGTYLNDRDGQLATKIKVVDQTRQVHQFMLEKSNVNPIHEMTALIETNRLVEMYQKAMNTQMDDMNSDAINKIASTRA